MRRAVAILCILVAGCGAPSSTPEISQSPTPSSTAAVGGAPTPTTLPIPPTAHPPTAQPSLASTEGAWYPSAYLLRELTLAGGASDVAYRWLTAKELRCVLASSGTCAGLAVIARDGCSSLHVEVELDDAAGTPIGFSNEMTRLLPRQETTLTFYFGVSGSAAATIIAMTCS